MRHRTDAEEPPIDLFSADVDRDIARLGASRHDDVLDWDQYLEVRLDLDRFLGLAVHHAHLVPASHTNRDSIWTTPRAERACSLS
jgi:hypothetical protein